MQILIGVTIGIIVVGSIVTLMIYLVKLCKQNDPTISDEELMIINS